MRLVLALTINAMLLALTFLFMNHLTIAIVVAISLIVWFFCFLWRRQKLVEARIEEKIAGQKVIMPVEHIELRAVESSGYSQTKGMGYIALTEDYLYFELALLNLEITVPTTKLRGVEIVHRLKGVSSVRKMLLIKFTNEKDEDDSIAINVKDMDQWENTIVTICGTEKNE
ncbi:MAG: hypothetical protein HRT89_11605 [Lentisphaeria bacterium]|nr:hypothetical protein [Lentisphaeria bacterium]NQZ68701.1 hypothetical protein [Lentisphaeria bacterium]